MRGKPDMACANRRPAICFFFPGCLLLFDLRLRGVPVRNATAAARLGCGINSEIVCLLLGVMKGR